VTVQTFAAFPVAQATASESTEVAYNNSSIIVCYDMEISIGILTLLLPDQSNCGIIGRLNENVVVVVY